MSMVRHNVALADRVWSVPIMVSAVVFALGLPPLGHTVGAMLLLGAAWTLRLSVFITWRSWGQPEERRYAQMRQRNEPHFAAQLRVHKERMAPGICVKAFQASQQASTICS